jgi:hypothetical protein
MADLLHKADFDPHIDTTFDIHFEDGGCVELELSECADDSKEGQESFSLIFKGPLDKPLPQRIYNIKHEKMGVLQLFLVPVMSDDKDAMAYQSVFNRMLE